MTERQLPGKLCAASFVPGTGDEVMVRSVGPLYVVYVNRKYESTWTTAENAYDRARELGYWYDGPTLESMMGG